MESLFEILLSRRLTSPQNTNVSPLQNQSARGLFSQISPHFTALFSLKKSFVDFDFDKFSGLQLLSDFVQDSFS
jgi:hypothetical protein